MQESLMLLFLSLFGSIVALIGGILFLYVPKWSSFLKRYSTPFGAGVLLTVAIVGLIPEAQDSAGENIFFTVLLSFIGAFLFEQFFFGIHHHECEDHEVKNSSSALVIVGDTIHNFVDGLAIGASFVAAPFFGLVTAFSTFLHEVPHEIGDFGILLKAGWKNKPIIIANLLSASVSLIGAYLVYFIPLSDRVIGHLLAFSAGIFLFLGASDFLPHVGNHEHKRNKELLALVFGVLIMLVTLKAIPHSHETEENHDEVPLVQETD